MKKTNQIEKLLADFEPKHTAFQIDNFIIAKSGDDWAQYKQALREIASRQDALINMGEQLEIDACGPPFWKRPALWLLPKKVRQIQAARRRRARANSRLEIAETERELARFVELAQGLKEKIGHLGNGDRDRLETKSWLSKARKMAGVDLLVMGRLSQSTMELILALPQPDRKELFFSLSKDAKPNPTRMIGL